MRVRANGLGLRDLDTLAALETGRYWTPAKRPSEAKHRLAINNGYWAEDILPNGLVLYVPLWLYSGAKFPSVDPYKHTCTITGTTWGPTGRSRDATDDVIDLGNNAAIGANLTGAFTIIIWCYIATGAVVDKYLVAKNNDDFSQYGIVIDANVKVLPFTTAGSLQGVGALTRDVWNCIAVGRDASDNGFIDINGVSDVTGTLGAPTAQTINLTLGCRTVTAGGYLLFFAVSIGEVFIYSQALSSAERTHMYNATRWRYR